MLTLAMAQENWFDFDNAIIIGTDGRPVELTAPERLLVRALRSGGLKARDTLVRAVWTAETVPPSAYDRALEMLVTRVRDKFELAGYNPQALKARSLLGYQLDEDRL